MSFDRDALERAAYDATGDGDDYVDDTTMMIMTPPPTMMMMTTTSGSNILNTGTSSTTCRRSPHHHHHHHLFRGPFDDFEDDIADEIIHLFHECK